jgi:dephospho-CoA kinase
MALGKVGNSANFIYSGFRSLAEAQLIKDRGGIILYIDAPDAFRYERIIERNRGNESFTLEDQQRLDEQERSSRDPLAESLDSVKNVSDGIVNNDGELQDLYRQLDSIVAKYANYRQPSISTLKGKQ